MSKIDRIRILIADDDAVQARALAQSLSHHGFETRVVTNGNEARPQILEFKPRLILGDLVLPGANAFDLLKFIQFEPALKDQTINLIVLSKHNSRENVTQAINNGARDYIVKPYKFESLLERIVFHCRGSRFVKELSASEIQKIDDSSLVMHLTDLVLRQALSKAPIQQIIFNLTQMVSMKVNGVRCSIVEVVDRDHGVVVISNDNKDATGLLLDLGKYPEVQLVHDTNVMAAIDNLESDPALKTIRSHLKEVQFNSLIVCPVTRRGHKFGVLSLRMKLDKKIITDNEIRFVEIVSHIVSLLLSTENPKQNGEFWRTNMRQAAGGMVLPFKPK